MSSSASWLSMTDRLAHSGLSETLRKSQLSSRASALEGSTAGVMSFSKRPKRSGQDADELMARGRDLLFRGLPGTKDIRTETAEVIKRLDSFTKEAPRTKSTHELSRVLEEDQRSALATSARVASLSSLRSFAERAAESFRVQWDEDKRTLLNGTSIAPASLPGEYNTDILSCRPAPHPALNRELATFVDAIPERAPPGTPFPAYVYACIEPTLNDPNAKILLKLAAHITTALTTAQEGIPRDAVLIGAARSCIEREFADFIRTQNGHTDIGNSRSFVPFASTFLASRHPELAPVLLQASRYEAAPNPSALFPVLYTLLRAGQRAEAAAVAENAAHVLSPSVVEALRLFRDDPMAELPSPLRLALEGESREMTGMGWATTSAGRSSIIPSFNSSHTDLSAQYSLAVYAPDMETRDVIAVYVSLVFGILTRTSLDAPPSSHLPTLSDFMWYRLTTSREGRCGAVASVGPSVKALQTTVSGLPDSYFSSGGYTHAAAEVMALLFPNALNRVATIENGAREGAALALLFASAGVIDNQTANADVLEHFLATTGFHPRALTIFKAIKTSELRVELARRFFLGAPDPLLAAASGYGKFSEIRHPLTQTLSPDEFARASAAAAQDANATGDKARAALLFAIGGHPGPCLEATGAVLADLVEKAARELTQPGAWRTCSKGADEEEIAGAFADFALPLAPRGGLVETVTALRGILGALHHLRKHAAWDVVVDELMFSGIFPAHEQMSEASAVVRHCSGMPSLLQQVLEPALWIALVALREGLRVATDGHSARTALREFRLFVRNLGARVSADLAQQFGKLGTRA
eukprot:gnl/Chilomastix_cuspidata/1018.p1 GENE.gnl/Chilomastix_cuspidata/1018~~gnl/Chilomastix_cuspidata/1018.p1  ORF type:complete len:816 (+),score=87.08 gnl/Chilomastix_cuspidata/1018:2-2449(+)